jgi:threonyl-tRNA synthetase
LAKPSVAISLLSEMESGASDLDEVSHSPFGWTKSYKLQVKGHPLAESSKVVTKDSVDSTDTELTSDALKGESKIRSYWKILSPDGTMTNIADFDFKDHKKLEILAKYESAKQRNADVPPPHVALMKKMAIADYEPASDSGNMRFFPNGRLIKSLIERFVTDKVKEYGGYEVETPIMYDSEHPSMVSYFNRFPARQYNIDSDGKKIIFEICCMFWTILNGKPIPNVLQEFTLQAL